MDGHVPGLGWAHGTGCQVKVLGFAQEGIQERAIGKWRKVDLETRIPQTECDSSQKARVALEPGVISEVESSYFRWTWMRARTWSKLASWALPPELEVLLCGQGGLMCHLPNSKQRRLLLSGHQLSQPTLGPEGRQERNRMPGHQAVSDCSHPTAAPWEPQDGNLRILVLDDWGAYQRDAFYEL